MVQMKYILNAVCWFFASAGVLLATGSAPKTLDQLVVASDDIVIGKIIDGAVSGVGVNFSLEIERVIKGAPTSQGIVPVTGITSEPLPTHAIARDRGIFFLAVEPWRPLRLIPPVSGALNERTLFIPLPSSAASVAQGSGAAPKQQILLEISKALESPEPFPPGAMIDFLWEYHLEPMASVQSVFRRWMEGSSPKLLAISLRALVAEGDTGALRRIASDESVQKGPFADGIFDAVKAFPKPDATAVDLLGRLATTESTISGLRVAAANALARSHTQQTLPYLAQLLDTQNLKLMTVAVGGLSSFANNVSSENHQPVEGDWKYRNDETIAHSAFDEMIIGQQPNYYVAFWKGWWQQNEQELR